MKVKQHLETEIPMVATRPKVIVQGSSFNPQQDTLTASIPVAARKMAMVVTHQVIAEESVNHNQPEKVTVSIPVETTELPAVSIIHHQPEPVTVSMAVEATELAMVGIPQLTVKVSTIHHQPETVTTSLLAGA